MKYLILGNGVAGIYGAKAIRELDNEGEIIVISEEAYPFYFRPRLPEVVAAEASPQEIEVLNAEWYKSTQIKLLLNKRVTAIDAAAKKVTVGHEDCSYDRLLIALGSRAQFPPIDGLDAEGVYCLRTVEDALELKKLGSTYKKAVLIGGGLLGLEAGFGLTKLGVEVTVVEFFDRLLPRQMDKEGAAILQKRLEGMGFNFVIGVTTESVSGTLGEKTLHIKDNPPLHGEFVLVSAGIKSNIEIPGQAGIECNRGVIVSDRMETSVRDVYAAGDVAEFNERVYGIWPAGMEQGAIAGNNMAGGSNVYAGTLPATTLKVAGITLSSFGQIADFESEVIEQKKADETALTYAKVFVAPSGQILGGIFLGEQSLGRKIQMLLKKNVSVLGYEEKLLRDDFDFSILEGEKHVKQMGQELDRS